MNNFEPSVMTLRLVAEIVKVGKLTTAAKRLHFSQSAASHALRVLEGQLNAALFVREWEGLRLSEAGQRVLPFIEQILANLDAVRAEVVDLSELKTGNLRVAGVPSLLATILPPLFREYGRLYPGVELSIFEGTDEEVRAWVISGMAQVGFAGLPVEGVMAEEVTQDEWLALLPRDGLPGKGSVTLRELARHKFLMSGGGCEVHIQKLFCEAEVATPQHFLVKQIATIQAMVAENLGVSLVPSLSVGKAGVRGCRAVRLRPRQFRKIGMLRAQGGLVTPAMKAWMEVVRRR